MWQFPSLLSELKDHTGRFHLTLFCNTTIADVLALWFIYVYRCWTKLFVAVIKTLCVPGLLCPLEPLKIALPYSEFIVSDLLSALLPVKSLQNQRLVFRMCEAAQTHKVGAVRATASGHTSLTHNAGANKLWSMQGCCSQNTLLFLPVQTLNRMRPSWGKFLFICSLRKWWYNGCTIIWI